MYIPGLNVKLTAPWGLLILRVVLGLALAIHGWAKWSGGVDGVAGFFGSVGIPAPQLFAWIVIIVELIGGLLLIVGFLTQIVGILVAIDMFFAIILVRASGGLLNENGTLAFSYELLILAAALCLALAGPGAWSVDDVVVDTRERT
jgi:putative oxidoreductase